MPEEARPRPGWEPPVETPVDPNDPNVIEMRKEHEAALAAANPTAGFNLSRLKKNLSVTGKKVEPKNFELEFLRAKIARKKPIGGLTVTQMKDAERILWEKGEASFSELKSEGGIDFQRLSTGLQSGINDAVASQDFVSEPFQDILRKESAGLSREGVPEEDARSQAGVIGEEIRDKFAVQFGREASQEETAAIFNRLNFPSTSVISATDTEGAKALFKQSDIESVFEDVGKKLVTLEGANYNLGNIGQKLTQEEVNRILSSGVSPERADVLAGSIVQSRRESDAQTKIDELKPTQLEAITKMGQDLAKGQAQALGQDFAPQIISTLRNRGLTPGPALSSALTELTGQMGREREATLAPMRAGVELGVPQQSLNFALRGAAESGAGLSTAKSFVQGLDVLGKQQGFTAGQSALDRSSKEQQMMQQYMIALAMQSGVPSGPSGLDYFFQSLPPAAIIAAAAIGASDIRLKEDIESIEGGLDKVEKMRGVRFHWKKPDLFGEGDQLGVVAQEVEKVLPEIVHDNGDIKFVNYMSIIPVLIEAVKEQQAQIRSLEDRLLGGR